MRERDDVKTEFLIGPYETGDEIGEIDFPSSPF